ncbi:hypothetical protein Dsin_021225 [Dipteronia sinensis]|uniref:Uncharacterized protein n=1 Tax=Dipteronia sinensis TaxID=43782 RepID=A0AAD9ZZQ7_9ROSI|nr:hypothetical protein Dsin_021225 [Dipteronia sinensis]
MVKAVGSLFQQGTLTARVLEEGLRVVVGMGDKARLWEDVLVEGTPLRTAFPRIYILAVKKSGCVRDFWIKEGMMGKREVPLRRNLFDWELEQWGCFKACLENLNIREIPGYNRLAA